MFDLLVDFLFGSVAMAQEAAAAGPKQNAFGGLFPIVAIFAIFYFLMLRPQKKRMDEEQKMNAALKKGDEVYTKSGVIGTITGLTEKVVTLEVSEGVKMKFLRSYVGGSTEKIFNQQPAGNEKPAVSAN